MLVIFDWIVDISESLEVIFELITNSSDWIADISESLEVIFDWMIAIFDWIFKMSSSFEFILLKFVYILSNSSRKVFILDILIELSFNKIFVDSVKSNTFLFLFCHQLIQYLIV